jgi:hypothetical protein
MSLRADTPQIVRPYAGRRPADRPVRFELAEQTRQAVDDYPKAANKKPGYSFDGRRPSRSTSNKIPIDIYFLSYNDNLIEPHKATPRT